MEGGYRQETTLKPSKACPTVFENTLWIHEDTNHLCRGAVDIEALVGTVPGPKGIDGINGTNGTNGINGVIGSINTDFVTLPILTPDAPTVDIVFSWMTPFVDTNYKWSISKRGLASTTVTLVTKTVNDITLKFTDASGLSPGQTVFVTAWD